MSFVRESKRRSEPKTGEVWEFSNGAIAVIAAISDPNQDTPEIAYTDAGQYHTTGRTGFKYNAVTDPMPIRKL